jgi:hypothetical protein
MTKPHKFLAYWDCLGFESITDITSYERQKIMSALTGETTNEQLNLNHMMLRARFNPQRSPEIWSFESELDHATLWNLAETDPQPLVDAIRNCGNKLYGMPKTEDRIK